MIVIADRTYMIVRLEDNLSRAHRAIIRTSSLLAARQLPASRQTGGLIPNGDGPQRMFEPPIQRLLLLLLLLLLSKNTLPHIHTMNILHEINGKRCSRRDIN